MQDATVPCATDPGRWFSKNEARRADAARVCGTCPFQDPCRELSNRPIEFHDSVYTVRNGVWAGEDKRNAPDEDHLSPKQRQTRQRIAEIRRLRSEDPAITKYSIGKKMGLGSGSVNNFFRLYIDNQEDA